MDELERAKHVVTVMDELVMKETYRRVKKLIFCKINIEIKLKISAIVKNNRNKPHIVEIYFYLWIIFLSFSTGLP